MGKNDLNKLIKMASQIADENAYVYGKQITKNHTDKEIFRPDSFIRLAVDPSSVPPTGPAPSGPAPSGPTPSGPAPSGPTPPPTGKGPKKSLFQSKLKFALDNPFKYDKDASTSDLAQRFFQAMQSEASGGDANMLKNYGLGAGQTFEDFWIALKPGLEKKLITVDYGVATVGQGGRGGEEVRSVFALGTGRFSVDLLSSVEIGIEMASVLQRERTKIIRAIFPSAASSVKETAQTVFNWWDALSNSIVRK